MRVLLRHSQTGYYYIGHSEWTAQSRDAGDFHNIERALRMVVQDNLGDMSIVVIYDESGTEQVFDLTSDIPAVRARESPSES